MRKKLYIFFFTGTEAMSEEVPGVGQGPAPLEEPPSPRQVRLNQIPGGNFIISQNNRVNVPALAQVRQ